MLRTAVSSSLIVSLVILATLSLQARPPEDVPRGRPIDARTQLVRPDPAVDEDANGDIRLKEHRGRSAIHVHLRHLAQGGVYDVNISRGEQSELLGNITIVGDDDHGRPPRPRCFEASPAGAEVVPAVDTTATGAVKLVLTGRNRTTLRYEIAVDGLSGPATEAHIHTGAAGTNGDVVHMLDHEALKGKVEISEDDIANLEAGNYYVDIHTQANPGGEIRGQIGICADGEDEMPDDRSGNGKLRIDTRRGDSLPLGANSVADLVGTTVTVSDAAGAVVLTGDIVDLAKHKFGRGHGRGGPPSHDQNGGGDGGGAVLQEPAFDDLRFVVVGRHDASFRRGDVNMDNNFDISDPVRALLILFRGETMPYCLDAADANDDGNFNISDPITMLRTLFQGGEPLPHPGYSASGFDRSGDSLFCEG